MLKVCCHSLKSYQQHSGSFKNNKIDSENLTLLTMQSLHLPKLNSRVPFVADNVPWLMETIASSRPVVTAKHSGVLYTFKCHRCLLYIQTIKSVLTIMSGCSRRDAAFRFLGAFYGSAQNGTQWERTITRSGSLAFLLCVTCIPLHPMCMLYPAQLWTSPSSGFRIVFAKLLWNDGHNRRLIKCLIITVLRSYDFIIGNAFFVSTVNTNTSAPYMRIKEKRDQTDFNEDIRY